MVQTNVPSELPPTPVTNVYIVRPGPVARPEPVREPVERVKIVERTPVIQIMPVREPEVEEVKSSDSEEEPEEDGPRVKSPIIPTLIGAVRKMIETGEYRNLGKPEDVAHSEETFSGSEEKTSVPEEKPSEKPRSEVKTSRRRKLKKFSGAGGRIHTEAQIDEILDFWLMTGELPQYVSERQRYSYRHHERVPERMELLEQRGIPIVAQLPGATGHTPSVIPIQRANNQRKTGAS